MSRLIKDVLKLSTIVTLILLLSFLSGCLDSPDGNDSLDGNEGEDFTFTMLDGTEKSLSDYRGKVVILDMMATWCGPCVYQMLELKKVYENYSRNDLEIISIDIDTYETAQQLQSYRDSFKEYLGVELNWVFGMDDGSIWEKYKIDDSIPTICIFDQKGRLHFLYEGIAVYSEIPPDLSDLYPPPPKLAQEIDELL